LRLMPVDLLPLIDGLTKEWLPIAEKLSLHLQLEVHKPHADGEGIVVLGDRLSLLRLMRIWLDNACKFTPAGGSVTISAVMTDESVLLSVEDTGIGIAEEHQPRIFDRFYRVSGGVNSHTNGAGLGLSLAAWIVEQHKTKIRLESVYGRGSRFQVSLPRVFEGHAGGDHRLNRALRAEAVSS